MRQLLGLLILIVSFQVCSAVTCPPSHFDYFGIYTLGKQNQLNRTFTKIQQKVTVLPNSTFNYSKSTLFTIFNAKTKFQYLDSHQRAQVLGNDIIIIQGGRLQVSLTFQWSKKNIITFSGTGSAIGTSDIIIFAKKVLISNGKFYGYQLYDYLDVSWGREPFKLTRIDPPDVSPEASELDKLTILKMLNSIDGVKTVLRTLQEQINKLFGYYLANMMQDQNMPISDTFEYIWTSNQNKKVTIPFSRRQVDVNFDKTALQLYFDTQVTNDKGWKCGNRPLPLIPFNPKMYGHAQQLVSYDFYENVIRYAINNQILDTELNNQNWGSGIFQFSAGDLYPVFDRIQDNFEASEVVLGSCKAKDSGLKVFLNSQKTFNVSILFNCELLIKGSKVSDFSVGLLLSVEGAPKINTLDFELRSYQSFITFYPFQDYKLLQQNLAKAMIISCLERLYQTTLFGSGWQTSPSRSYPIFLAVQNYTFLYDPSQVDKKIKNQQ